MKGLILWDKRIYSPAEYENAMKNPVDDSVSYELMQSYGENGLSAFYIMIINDKLRTRVNSRNKIRQQALKQTDNIAEEILINGKKCDYYVIASFKRFEPICHEIFKGDWRKYGELGVKGRVAIHNLMRKIDSGEFS